MIKKIIIFFFLFFANNLAFAGDGATIISEGGVIIKLRNGYQQLATALQNNNSKNQIVEIKVEGENFHLNLDRVALICRDDCKAANITYPKKNEK